MSSLSTLALFTIPALVACGGSDKPGSGVDAPVVAQTITVSGVASDVGITGSTPLQGVLVEAFASSDESTPVAMATSDAMGKYSIVLPTGGAAVDGFLKATKATYKDTYLYPPATLAANFDAASINMLTPGNFSLLSDTLCAASQDATGKGAIAVIVDDAASMNVAGATVTSSPAATKYCYNQNKVPNKNAAATDADGIAYMFNVTGDATVSATKSGTTFKSHSVNARAGAFTTTLITP
jgi:hypothetical protein